MLYSNMSKNLITCSVNSVATTSDIYWMHLHYNFNLEEKWAFEVIPTFCTLVHISQNKKNTDESPFRQSNARKCTPTTNGVQWSRLERVGSETSWTSSSPHKLFPSTNAERFLPCTAQHSHWNHFLDHKLCLLSLALAFKYCSVNCTSCTVTQYYLLLIPALWNLNLRALGFHRPKQTGNLLMLHFYKCSQRA